MVTVAFLLVAVGGLLTYFKTTQLEEKIKVLTLRVKSLEKVQDRIIDLEARAEEQEVNWNHNTISLHTGDLLIDGADVLVNTVNTKGVMGGGIAAQFKKQFPEMFYDYAIAAMRGEVKIGRMHIYTRSFYSKKFIFNFPTKEHYVNPSKMSYIREGLRDLVQAVKLLEVQSVAIPALGAGLGGLPWDDVFSVIQQDLVFLTAQLDVDGVDFRIYPPQ